MTFSWLSHAASLLILLPILGALLVWTFPSSEGSGARALGLVVASLELVLALYVWTQFSSGESAPQFMVDVAWLPSFGVHYAVGLDGISMLLVVLTALLTPIAILASVPAPIALVRPLIPGAVAPLKASANAEAPPSVTGAIAARSRDFVALMLLLEGAMVGAFVAQDLLLFYTFWEGMLVPAYFLVGVFGGDRRVHATLQFFLYTMAGSMLLLVALVGTASIGHAGGTPSFLYADVVAQLHKAALGPIEVLLFAGFAVAFLIKVPVLPLHAWLSETYSQAPATAMVLLSGVMVKVGAYGLLRYALLLFPRSATLAMPLLLFLATASCLWAAWLAYGQSSLRRIVAYSSISHMGLVVLGLLCVTPTSITGSAVQMFNHGITTGALFLWVGMLEQRRRTCQLADLGGLASEAPVMAMAFVLLAFASMGLPGLNGFIGEFMILLGAFNATGLGLSTPEGRFAQAGIIFLMAACSFIAIYVTWLLYSLEGLVWRSPLGRLLRVLAAAAAGLGAWSLVMVPTNSFDGGLLVQPFFHRTLSGLPFTEPLQLAACIATLSVVMAAAYLLRGVERSLFGPLQVRRGMTPDLSGRERLVLMPLLFLTVALGLHPKPLIDTALPTVTAMVQQFRSGAGWPSVGPDAAASVEAAPPSFADALLLDPVLLDAEDSFEQPAQPLLEEGDAQ